MASTQEDFVEVDMQPTNTDYNPFDNDEDTSATPDLNANIEMPPSSEEQLEANYAKYYNNGATEE